MKSFPNNGALLVLHLWLLWTSLTISNLYLDETEVTTNKKSIEIYSTTFSRQFNDWNQLYDAFCIMNRNGPLTGCCRRRRVNRTNRVQETLETQVEHQHQLRVLQQLAQAALLAEFRPQVTCPPASRGSKHPMARSHSAFLGEWNSLWVGKPLGIRIVKLYVTDMGDDGITDEESSTTPWCWNLILHKKGGCWLELCQTYKTTLFHIKQWFFFQFFQV